MEKGNSYFDLFEIDHSKYQMEEEVVKEGNPNVDDVADLDKDTEENKEEQEAESNSDAKGEEKSDSEEKGGEKQTEESEESEEDASPATKDDKLKAQSSDLETLVNSLIDDETLSFETGKDYEDSPEGLKSLIQDTVNKKTEEALKTYKESLPKEASALLEAIEKGVSVKDYLALKSEIDFSTIPLEKEDGSDLVSNQRNLVEDYLINVQKLTKEEAEEMLQDYSDSGLLKKQAELAKKKLVVWQKEKEENLVREREAQLAKEVEENKKQAAEFKKEVTSLREIAGFKLDKNKAEKLYDFITKPVKDGKTAYQLKDSQENRLLYAFMAMEGFNKDNLIKEERTKSALKLKKKLSNYTDKQSAPKRGGDDVRKIDEAGIGDINWII